MLLLLMGYCGGVFGWKEREKRGAIDVDRESGIRGGPHGCSFLVMRMSRHSQTSRKFASGLREKGHLNHFTGRLVYPLDNRSRQKGC